MERRVLSLLLLLNQPGFGVYVLVAASGWVVLGIWQAVYPTIQAELFPASVRVSGIGFSHQLVIAVFGGTAPLIAAGADFLAVCGAVWNAPEGEAAAVARFAAVLENRSGN